MGEVVEGGGSETIEIVYGLSSLNKISLFVLINSSKSR